MYFITLFVVCIAYVGAKSNNFEWTVEDYPNPQQKPERCGRPPHKKSWICDPNGIITKEEARVLDYMIEAIASNRSITPCPCSAEQCRRDGGGYKIGIALMTKIKMEKNDKLSVKERQEKTVQSARNFAYTLMTREWSYGNCEESVIILFSQQDNIIFMMSGDTAKLKLTDEIMKAITDHAGPHFAPGQDVSVGLKYMVIHLRNVFNDQFYSLTPIYGRGGAEIVATSISLTIAALTSVFYATS